MTEASHDGTVVRPFIKNPGDDGVAVVSYLNDGAPCQNIEITDPKEFRAMVVPQMRWFLDNKPTLEQWRTNMVGALQIHFTFVDYLKEDFKPRTYDRVAYAVAPWVVFTPVLRYVLVGDAESPHLLKWARGLAAMSQVELHVASSRGFLPAFDAFLPPHRRLALRVPHHCG